MAKRKAIGQGLVAVGEPAVGSGADYERDFYSWAETQAAAMKRGAYDEVDWPNVIEEVEYLARRERRRWASFCTRVVQHMLKILYTQRTGDRLQELVDDWVREITPKFRKPMRKQVAMHPGMQSRLDDMLAEAWDDGCSEAADSLGEWEGGKTRSEKDAHASAVRAQFPRECPWNLVEVAGYNPRDENDKAEPDIRVFPADVALRINSVLGTEYPECGWDVEYPNGPARTRDEIEQRDREGRGRGRAYQSSA